MNEANALTPSQFLDVLLHAAPVRPVFVWGPPGIGKSALVEQFAASVGLDCVSLLGSQLAPEDLIGVPQILPNGTSRFCPPATIARDEPYCLFLDELNACSLDVQRAFYSLIHGHRLGEYRLPKGSLVIGAGNRVQDMAIVKPLSSALLNRMIHVHLKPDSDEWLSWAQKSDLHPAVVSYLKARPDHLWASPSKTEEPFSTPRSWHMVSDLLKEYGEALDDEVCATLARGCLSASHAGQFQAFLQIRNQDGFVEGLLKGEVPWPAQVEERDRLSFLAHAFRAKLVKELPHREPGGGKSEGLTAQALRALRTLTQISAELAESVIVGDVGAPALPDWFLGRLRAGAPRPGGTR